MATSSDSVEAAGAPVRTRFAHIPGLDGMRGLWVVLGPLLYHAHPSFIPGGILALDLFFVLSSYLIVSIALNEFAGTGRIDVGAYAGRRARRLLPALLFTLAVLTIYLLVEGTEDMYARWTGAIVSALFYCANWYEAFSNVSYFEQFANPSPLVHVWSFAVEEQFYLFAPFFIILVMAVFKRRGLPALGVLSVIGALASAAWMSILYTGGDPSRVYYGTDTRAQALFVGITLAVVHRLWGPPRSRAGRTLAIAGAYAGSAFYLYAVFNISHLDTWMYDNGGFLLVAVAAAFIVNGVVVPSRGPLHRFYELSPVRWTGRISYGLYLYHWPIYLLVIKEARLRNSWNWAFVGLALTFLVATASFYLLEQPVMQRRVPAFPKFRLQPWPAAFAALSAVMAILLGLVAVNAEERAPVLRQVIVAPESSDDASTNAPGTSDAADLPRILVVGDSVSSQLAGGLIEWSQAHPGKIVVYDDTHIGCIVARYGEKRLSATQAGPVGDLCSAWNDPVPLADLNKEHVVSWPTSVDYFRPDYVIAHITPWDIADRKVPQLGDHWTHVGNPDFDAYAESEYRLATQVLTARGAHMIWLKGAHLNREINAQNSPERVDRLNEIVAEAVTGIPDVTLADFPAFIGPVGSAQELRLRGDGVHLSPEGIEAAVDWLLFDVLELPIQT